MTSSNELYDDTDQTVSPVAVNPKYFRGDETQDNKNCRPLRPTGIFISKIGQKRCGGGSAGWRPHILLVSYSQDKSDKLISSRHPG